MSTKKLLKSSWVLVTAAAAGCTGGPGPDDVPDGCVPGVPCNPPTPDAAIGPPDFCARMARTSPGAFKYAEIDESFDDGGLIWIENAIFPDGVSRVVASATFYACQDEAQKLPGLHAAADEPLSCHWVGNGGSERIWPFADSSTSIGAEATYPMAGRRYRDIGDKLTLEAEGLFSFDLVKYENHIVPFAGGAFYEMAYAPAPSPDPTLAIPAERVGGAHEIEGGVELTLTFSGSDVIPPTEWAFEDVDGTRFAGLEMAPRPIVTEVNGAVAHFSGGTSGQDNEAAELVLAAGRDLDIRYDSHGDTIEGLRGFVMIYQQDPTVEVTHICVHDHPGRVILPASLQEQMAPTGSIFIGNYYHHLRTLDGETRVDLIGASSTSASYRFEAAP